MTRVTSTTRGPASSAGTVSNTAPNTADKGKHGVVLGIAGHAWGGNPHSGVFDRYALPGTVTGKAQWQKHAAPSGQPGPQPGTPASPPTLLPHQHVDHPTTTVTGGFTRYVIPEISGAAPKWQQPVNGGADGAGHQHWQLHGTPGTNGANPPRLLPQGIAGTNGGNPPKWLAQGTAGVNGGNPPKWLQETGGAQQSGNVSALNRFTTSVHGWWRNHQPLWAGGAQAGGPRKPAGQHPTRPTATPKK